MVSGGPREPLLQHFARNVFQCDLRNDFFTICDRLGLQKGSQGRAHEGPTNQLFRHFFDSAPLGGPLGHSGQPNDPRGHQNDTKMTPMFLAWGCRSELQEHGWARQCHQTSCKNDNRHNEYINKNIEKAHTNIQQPITVSGHGGGFAAGSWISGYADICIHARACMGYVWTVYGTSL